MPRQTYDWMDASSDAAKWAEWKTAMRGAAPHEAWYFSPGFDRFASADALYEAMRLALWGETKPRVIRNVDAKVEESRTIDGIPLIRVSMPEKFVPRFEAAGSTFYLYSAIVGDTEIDFARMWNGLRATRSRTAARQTIMGDVSQLVGADEMPVPRGVLRAASRRADAPAANPVTAEVVPFPSPRIVERPHPVVRARPPEELPVPREPSPTMVPDHAGSTSVSDGSVWDLFAGDEVGTPVSPVPPRVVSAVVADEPPPYDPRPARRDQTGLPEAYGLHAFLVTGVCLVLIAAVAWYFLTVS